MGEVGTPRKLDPHGRGSRRTRPFGYARGGRAGHRGVVQLPTASMNSVDPLDSRAPRILTTGEVKDSGQPLGNLISTAQEELDRLYKVVREAGYTILFCDTAGVAIEHRGDATGGKPVRILGNLAGRRLGRGD